MLKNIALAAAVVLAVGCGAARPQRPTQDYTAATKMWLDGATLTFIKTSLSLADESEARALVRGGLIDAQHRYNNLR